MSYLCVDKNLLKNSKMCRYNSYCLNPNCSYSHSLHEKIRFRKLFIDNNKHLVNIPNKLFINTTFCNYNLKGKCQNGKKCKYAHSILILSNAVDKLFDFIISEIKRNNSNNILNNENICFESMHRLFNCDNSNNDVNSDFNNTGRLI